MEKGALSPLFLCLLFVQLIGRNQDFTVDFDFISAGLVEETVAPPGVARGPGLIHLHQNRIAIAIQAK